MKKIIYSAVVILASFSFSACSDFLDVSPSYELPNEDVVTNLKEAQAALDGVYVRFISRRYYGCDMVTYGDVRGEDVGTAKTGDRTDSQFKYSHTTALTSTNAGLFWEHLYGTINKVNNLLQKINEGSVIVTDEEKADLADIKSQALVLRAFLHFDLVRIYGEPYLKNKDAYGIIKADRIFQKEEQPVRSTVAEIYSFILSDLTTAIGTAPANYTLSTSKADGAVNLWAAKAFMSKVYLYMGMYNESYNLATEVIESGVYSLIDNRDYVRSWGEAFTTEAIFEIYTSDVENADRESLGSVINPNPNLGYGAVCLTDTTANLYPLLKADPNDCRLGVLQKAAVRNSSAYFYNKKYPGREGNVYVNNPHLIRLSEVYLIAAEAGALSDKPDAVDYLNAIRLRANPAAVATPSTVVGQDLADLVMIERRKELFGEGHRFFDITRNLGTNEVRRPGTAVNPIGSRQVPVISWNNNDTYLLILPIPSEEMDNNTNMQQNPEY